MNNVKTIFSIKDLENLSGIKAHTIRIWEKRYAILQPMRSDTNIRFYDLQNLQKLLNITMLHKHGYKISKIATFPDEKIPALVKQIISDKSVRHHAVNAFKIAMMNFDQALFFSTYNSLLAERSFGEVFYEVFIPLLNEIGLLWQTETITPAHEHFISYLVRQKILTNTEKLQANEPQKTDKVFILFLPIGEIHELGLLYINYEIILRGYKSIYLGESLPVHYLKDIRRHFDNITFVSYFTVQPHPGDAGSYVDKMSNEILDERAELWLLGRNTEKLKIPDSQNIKLYTSIAALVDNL
ncbi:MAG TPA: MerR family transcriptional regulator [Flavobacterium sp.]|jgi:DNA-binding transcriptional MerR regulator